MRKFFKNSNDFEDSDNSLVKSKKPSKKRYHFEDVDYPYYPKSNSYSSSHSSSYSSPYYSNNKWDSKRKTNWNWEGYNSNSNYFYNRFYESNVKTPEFYVLPSDEEIRKYVDGDITEFKDFLYLSYYANLTKKTSKDILKEFNSTYNDYYNKAKIIAEKKLSIFQSALTLKYLTSNCRSNNPERINMMIDSFVRRRNNSKNEELGKWIGESKINFKKENITKLGIIDKMCLFEDFGEKFKVVSDDITKFVHNAKQKKNAFIQKFEQINKVRKFEYLLPTFNVKLLNRSLNVALPAQTEIAKQKVILLVDYSGSMGTYFKQEWVSAIILNRIKYIFDNECEIYFAFYIGDLRSHLKYISTKEEAYAFWENFSTKPNGGETNIHRAICSVNRDFLNNPSKYTSLNGKLPEILVVCDGEDDLFGDPILKTNIITILNYNDEMREYSISSGGSYVNITEEDIEMYTDKEGNPSIIKI